MVGILGIVTYLVPVTSDVQPAVSLPLEPEQKGQKRNGSPSYLAACSKVLTKRQCPLEASQNFPEPPTCRSQAIAENEEVKEVELNVSPYGFDSLLLLFSVILLCQI